MSSIIFIVFLVIILKFSANQTNKKKNTPSVSKYYNPNVQGSNSSYYTQKKVASYQKMNMDHQNHGKNIHTADDPCKDIGYKRCPKCQNVVSKKAKNCFMCDYKFVGETIEK